MKNNGVRTIAGILCFLLCSGVCTGCGSDTGNTAATSASAEVEREVFAMDTYMTIKACGAGAEAAVEAAEQEILRLDELLSVSGENSEIRRVNDGETVTLSEDTAALVEQALTLAEETDGAFDVTIYPLMKAWGFPSGAYQVVDAQQRSQLLTLVGSKHVHYDGEAGTLRLDAGTEIDLGGIAMGYLGDRLAEIMEEYGVSSAMISLGSSTIRLVGEKSDGSAWNIALRDPKDSGAYLGVLSVRDCVIDTSGGYERYFEQDGKTYWHILDPATGAPADSGLRSVTIVGENGAEGDGLSTALFVMGKEKALAYWRNHADDFDVVLVEDTGEITVTEGVEVAFASQKAFAIARKEGKT